VPRSFFLPLLARRLPAGLRGVWKRRATASSGRLVAGAARGRGAGRGGGGVKLGLLILVFVLFIFFRG
jgi:hypothetical protein